jgi:hypothetical protein
MNLKPVQFTFAAVAVLALAACTISITFDYTKSQAHVTFGGASAVSPAPIPFDLSSQPDIQAHKSNIKSITLGYIDATVSTVDAANNVTSINNGSVTLHATGAAASTDVTVALPSSLSIVQGQTVRVAGSPQLDSLVMSIIQGAGSGTLTITGTASSTASTPAGTAGSFMLDLKFHLSMEYGT